jgi:hypothetical protein
VRAFTLRDLPFRVPDFPSGFEIFPTAPNFCSAPFDFAHGDAKVLRVWFRFFMKKVAGTIHA